MLKHPEEAALRYRVEESEEKKTKKKNKEAEFESEEDMETEGQEKDEKSGEKDDENKDENGEKGEKEDKGENGENDDKDKAEKKTEKKKQQKQKEKSQFDPEAYLSVNNSVYLRDFEAKTHPQREEILQKYQQELQELMENALLFHAGYHNPKGISFGISVLNNLGKVFTQFLAWQRLMQMIENLSEPVKKDENFARHNKRGLLESQLASQQGGIQKKYKYRQPETDSNVQITGPVSKLILLTLKNQMFS
jgi:hypothetical protein